MWRHGDVLIQECSEIPSDCAELSHCTLAKGEVTGHAHRVEPREAAKLYRGAETLFLRVSSDSARLVHEEHATITLKRGDYRVWIQREYSPEAIRHVVD
jgi:hypothetical protein